MSRRRRSHSHRGNPLTMLVILAALPLLVVVGPAALILIFLSICMLAMFKGSASTLSPIQTTNPKRRRR